jgi:hypothetical protein
MIKILIGGKQVDLIDGEFKCKDKQILAALKLFSQAFDLDTHDYHPQPDLQRMVWICEKSQGSIIYVQDPPEADPTVEY